MLLTSIVELGTTGILSLAFWRILTDFPFEGHEKVLAELLRNVHLQIGSHEELESFIVNWLQGRREERNIPMTWPDYQRCVIYTSGFQFSIPTMPPKILDTIMIEINRSIFLEKNMHILGGILLIH